jgi:D-inositol-3-phosphate glycosyltransferase
MRFSVLMALLFYPRGGSAQVVRYLAPALCRAGVDARVVSGSLGSPGDHTHAPTFFEGLPVYSIDYSDAVLASQEGRDPIAQPVPLHPSYEDRASVPDRVFTAVSTELAAHLEESWQSLIAEPGRDVDLFHLHHLTPIQAAARAAFPGRPIVGHLHGTELKMLQYIREREAIARRLGLSLDADAGRVPELAERNPERLDGDRERRIVRETRWGQWRYAGYWSRRLREYARLCDRLIALAPHVKETAVDVLGVDPDRIAVLPNGVDTGLFDRRDIPPRVRLQHWRTWLVDDARGWDESGEPGSVRYREADLRRIVDLEAEETHPVILFVGRFVTMKRVPLLLRAYARARPEFREPAPLVIWGGNPGEWEGQHPVTIAREQEIPDVFFTGWRGHEDLPAGLNCSDIMVAPSTNEPFGQVYIEAMACGVPVIASRSGGPETFVNTEPGAPNGWLVEPDDEAALAGALVEAVNNREERHRRAEHAYAQVRAVYSWNSIAHRFADLYREVLHEHRT